MSERPEATPRALRAIISIIGRTNVGKSTLLNAICGQEVSIVSELSGTTTDVVAKPYELLPLGAVTFYDTAGFGDEGVLGDMRLKATQKAIAKSDMVLMVVGKEGLLSEDKKLIIELTAKGVPLAVVFNMEKIVRVSLEDEQWLMQKNIMFEVVSAKTSENVDAVKQMLVRLAPEDFKKEYLLAGDLFEAGDIVLMVVPIDYSAPKGRLILPQVQTLREILDKNAKAIVVKDDDLSDMLSELKNNPRLIICDSQVVMKVAKMVPEDVPVTTFSILFARNKGDIEIMYQGANAMDSLADGDRILIAEACSHHVADDDIGKVKIPNWIRKYTGKNIEFDFCQGCEFPNDLEKYSLVIHCGACMLNRVEMVRRLKECVRRGVPITNYGVAICKTQGVLQRMVKPLGLN
ncbi:MAG: [FeFe] hydrogenase H-cluster maturation GTPase HydF [Alphaproteobacteria bacterium]|nr:[FeFe] hydrogenase H-cluster maturation GTPase HydF [Alphaproteobacteria bacterium]